MEKGLPYGSPLIFAKGTRHDLRRFNAIKPLNWQARFVTSALSGQLVGY
jgi:hypothetical protein